jgi:hypothetical protein
MKARRCWIASYWRPVINFLYTQAKWEMRTDVAVITAQGASARTNRFAKALFLSCPCRDIHSVVQQADRARNSFLHDKLLCRDVMKVLLTMRSTKRNESGRTMKQYWRGETPRNYEIEGKELENKILNLSKYAQSWGPWWEGVRQLPEGSERNIRTL